MEVEHIHKLDFSNLINRSAYFIMVVMLVHKLGNSKLNDQQVDSLTEVMHYPTNLGNSNPNDQFGYFVMEVMFVPKLVEHNLNYQITRPAETKAHYRVGFQFVVVSKDVENQLVKPTVCPHFTKEAIENCCSKAAILPVGECQEQAATT